MSLSLFRKKLLVGLDMGHHTIKAVLMERSSNGWRLAKVVSTPTPPDSIRDGVVVNQEDVAEAIRQLLRKSHINATSAIISVAGASVVVRTVRIPKMPETTLRKSIKFEAGRYVPTSVEDSFIEFEILGPVDDNQMDVLIVAAPKDIVESRVGACQAAGLDVDVVDIEPFAAFRALVEADPQFDLQNLTLAVIDIGAYTTNVSVVSKGVFAMTRSINQGGATLTKELVSYFDLSPDDAESGKSQLDLRDLMDDSKPLENPPLRVIQPHVDELVREIRRSLNYYQSQQTEGGQPNPVNSVLVCGGGAKLLGMPEYIAHKLEMIVTPAGVLENPRFVYAGTDELGSGMELSVASGLAMRAFSKAA